MTAPEPEGAKPLGPPMTYELHSALTRIPDDALLRAYEALGASLTNPHAFEWWRTLLGGLGVELRAELVRRRRDRDTLAATIDDAVLPGLPAIIREHYIDEPMPDEPPLPTLPGEIRLPKPVDPDKIGPVPEPPYPPPPGPLDEGPTAA